MGGADARDTEPPAVRSEVARARRRVKRHRIALICGVVVVTVLLGLVLGFRSSARLVDEPDPSPTVQGVGVALVVLGLVVCVVGGVRARRAGALRLAWNSSTVGLERALRRRLLAQIRTDEEVPQAERAPAVALAGQLIRTRFLMPAYGGLMIYFVGEALTTSFPFTRWACAVVLVLFTIGVPLVLRDARRAQRWLDHHAATDA